VRGVGFGILMRRIVGNVARKIGKMEGLNKFY
jgi:hypothetical protein